MSGKKYLSDALDINDIVQSPKRKFCIISGVGSGKNYFVENVLSGYGNILYISSRRAKVDEILINKACNEKINWDNEFNDIVSTTNYGIEMMVKNEKFCTYGIKNTLKHFEYIVLDEAHSLYTDATYTDAPFHIMKLLEYVEKKFPKIKIILMTGTPEPMKILLQNGNYEIIDKRNECINVIPKQIEVIPYETAINYMRNLPDSQKTIYYSNSATRLVKGDNSILKKITKIGQEGTQSSGIKESEVTFCMSDNSIAKLQTYRKSLGEECRDLKSYITQKNKLPEGKKILLTTATLKEGVNIEDDNIKIAFCESHILSDIQQFAGRVRKGLDILYVIDNSKQFIKSNQEMRFAQMEIFLDFVPGTVLKSINEFYKKTVMSTESILYTLGGYDNSHIEDYKVFIKGEFSSYHSAGECCKDYIDFIQKKNEYIRFNHLIDKFEMYVSKFAENNRCNREFIQDLWLDKLKEFASQNQIVYIPPVRDEKEEVDCEKLKVYLKEKENISFINYNGRNELLDDLRDILHLSSNCKIKTINEALKRAGQCYELKSIQPGRGKRGYRLIRIDEE
ncbi:MAG: DEAD/DEAH box helicase family protein [Lachnospiraceae bacterium]